jgi:soluble lytic murein transglycosylase-like protein
MIVESIVCFSMANMIVMAADEPRMKTTALMNGPRTAVVSSNMRLKRESHLRALELRRLRQVVCALGGKPHHAPILLKAGQKFEIDPIFLAAVTHVESSFRPRARSGRGACGLMQLRPIVTNAYGVTNPWDARQNIMGGAAYLRTCFYRYRKHSNSTFLALAAYNIGPGPAEKLRKSPAAKRFVKKVLLVYNRFTSEPIRISRRF